MNPNISRRDFLKFAGMAGVTAGIAAACQPVAPPVTHTTSPQNQTGGDMDALHEEGVKKFVELIGKDDKFWKAPLAFKMDGDVKVFEVKSQDIDWEIASGQTVQAMAYNGRVPGPEIRITEGDKVRVVLTNEMEQSTSIHFHGVMLPNAMDGVPFITQPVVKKGETFTYEFTAR